MIAKNCDLKVPIVVNSHNIKKYINNIDIFHKKIMNLLEQIMFDKAIECIIEFANIINKNLNDQAPWNLKKAGKIEEMNEILYISLDAIRVIAIWLQSFIPFNSSKMLDLLNINHNDRKFCAINNLLISGNKINNPELIFSRL
jgi:methionyl-tRNA synthetase